MPSGSNALPRRVRIFHGVSLAVLCQAVVLQGCSLPAPPTTARPQLRLSAQDRLLILAPHPDDEVLCCGGVIQQALAMGLPVHVVFFTYGDNNQWSFLVYRKHPVVIPEGVRRMGLVRHDEALAADQRLGLSPEHLTFLGYPDFGTLHIWQTHWDDRPAFRSMLTHVTEVPYQNAFRPGAPYKGEEILHDLTTILRAFKPTKVFVSHPGDHMPDHAALYLFTRVALWDLEPAMAPEVYPYLIHLAHWPRPRGFQPTKFLEPPAPFREQIEWQEYRLSREALEQKHRALQAHRTQYESSARYLLSFIRPNELFGEFPVVHLNVGTTPAVVASGQAEGAAEAPEELTEEERAKFVGLEERRMWVEEGALVLSVTYSRPLAEAVELSVFAFGYRSDRPFGQMPKLHLKLGALSHKVLDQDQVIANAGITVERQPTQVTVRIPLTLLGDPQRILTSARTSLGELPLDWISWRVLELQET